MIKLIPFFLIITTLILQNNDILANNNPDKPNIYFLAGQGADHRLFKKIALKEDYKIQHINYTVPEKGMTMSEYAIELSEQIDTTQPFILIGTSLGGMLATEMGDFLTPEKIIIIASAKKRSDLPFRYRFQKKVPIYKLVFPKLAWWGAFIMQPIVEPDRKQENETFKQMLKDLDPIFLHRTINMIINWERNSYAPNIIHIHGNKDRTIPIRNLEYDHLIENGSHMMTLTRGEELSLLLDKLL